MDNFHCKGKQYSEPGAAVSETLNDTIFDNILLGTRDKCKGFGPDFNLSTNHKLGFLAFDIANWPSFYRRGLENNSGIKNCPCKWL